MNAEWIPTRIVKALDLLSAIVMLEQCDHETTIVDAWIREGINNFGALHWSGATKIGFHSLCVRCLVLHGSRTHIPNRAALLDGIKEGRIQIVGVHARSKDHQCQRCFKMPEVNQVWVDELMR